MKLPEKFLDKMKDLLKEEYEAFLKSYDEQRFYGLRVNTLKVSVEQFLKASPFELDAISWAEDGFYYHEGDAPGKHPYYHAGLYYIQEPSAMAPGAIIDAKPGDKILDLCAAPGGKTIQIAAKLNGQGVLVANDINAGRVKALVKNIELYGVTNAVITNETPQHLADKFAGYFDKILVDAPCSGEGMMRKDEQAAKSWEKYDVHTCCTMQRDILEYADRMLKDRGIICYSTCTFSPEENEGSIEWFLNRNPDYKVLSIEKAEGMDKGRHDWVEGREVLDRCIRFWPHKVKGEGHFVALLQKKAALKPVPSKNLTSLMDKEVERLWQEFAQEVLKTPLVGTFQIYGHNIHIIPNELPDIRGLNVVRTGLQLGSVEKGRFEPSQALVMALKRDDFNNILDLSAESHEVIRYLKGETLMTEGQKGWTVVCVDGHPLGWGKQGDGILKNGYPKAWRKMG
ncbi:MAG: RsmF rRNA methyltransferase first C-terminal domain-containing protein, partial [Clostridia bacterium]